MLEAEKDDAAVTLKAVEHVGSLHPCVTWCHHAPYQEHTKLWLVPALQGKYLIYAVLHLLLVTFRKFRYDSSLYSI